MIELIRFPRLLSIYIVSAVRRQPVVSLFGTALGQRHFAFEKLEYRLEEEFGCEIRPAVKAAPRSIL